MAKFRSQMGLGRSEVDRHAVRDRRPTRSVASSTAPLGLALRKQTRQARATPRGAVNVAVNGLRRNSGLQTLPFHPTRDLLRRPSQGKAVRDVRAQAGGARDPRATQLPGPGAAISAVRPIAL